MYILFIIFVFLIIISILILAHEFGHFIIAKRAGVKVLEFALGFPPKIWSKRIGETVYSVNALPLGGYVRLYGEDSSVEENQDKAFYHKSKTPRALVAVAGISMNFLLGILAFTVINFIQGIPTGTQKIIVDKIAAGSPAQAAKLQKGDVFVAVDNQKFSSIEEFQKVIGEERGKSVDLKIERSGKIIEVFVTPRKDYPEGQGPLGVSIGSEPVFYQPPLLQRTFAAIRNGISDTLNLLIVIFAGLGALFSQLFHGVVPKDVTGPVGIVQATGFVVKLGLLPVISWVGILSVNLAVINVLPFPGLDGGRLLFIVAEAIFGRRVLPKLEGYIHMIGIIILLALVALISVNDVGRIAQNGFFSFPLQ